MKSGVTQAAIDAFNADTIYLTHRVIMEFTSNRHNDGLVVTSTPTKVVQRGIDNVQDVTGTWWRPEDVYNNQNYNTMKYLVCDKGMTINEKPNGTGPRCMNIDDPDEGLERGWWSAALSDNVLGDFAVDQFVQAEFYEGTIYTNTLNDVHVMPENENPGEIEAGLSAFIANDPNDEPKTPKGRLVNRIQLNTMEHYPNCRGVTVQYKDNLGAWIDVATNYQLGASEYEKIWTISDTIIYGLKVIVHSTQELEDQARISELNAYYIKDISDDVVSINLSSSREEYQDSTVPIGRLVANTCDLTLDNTDGYYNPFGSSEIAEFLGANLRFTVELGVDKNADPDNPDWEYMMMGEFWTDEWNVSSDSLTADVNARDFSKFLQDESELKYGHVWTNTTVNAPIQTIMARANKKPEQVIIDEYDQTEFSILFIKDKTAWDFMSEIALADQGSFGFDNNGNFYYHSYNKLNKKPHRYSVATLDDSTNIISGDHRTEIYANDITVEVSPYNTSETGVRKLWSPSSPTILSYAKLGATINETDTTIPVVAAERQANGNLTSNGWTDVGGLLWFPNTRARVPDDGGNGAVYVENGEVVRYKRRSDSEFLECERGYLNTPAQTHNAGDYIGEVRYYEIEFDNSPVLSPKFPFVTAIDSLLEIEGEGEEQAAVIIYQRDAFVARLAIGNLVEYFTWLMGRGQTIKDFDIKDQDAEIDFATSVSGEVAIENAGRESVKENLGDPTAANKDLIRRYGKNSITISSDWIQSRQQAQKIANILVDEYQYPRRIIDTNTLGMPYLDPGDRVTVQTLDQLNISNQDFHIIGMDISYDGSLDQTLTLRQVKYGT